MTRFIDLERRFRDLTKAELEEPELLASLNDSVYGPAFGWSELLKHPRVVLLAEAGSGKTVEMQEQAKRLVAEGEFAFFVALESLDREPLEKLLSTPQERLFVAWKEHGDAPAWFFLDAVDELKLTSGKLDRAVQRLAKTVDGHLDRTRIVISSRPNDWRSLLDLAIVRDGLPLPDKQQRTVPSPDEIFLAALRRERGESTKKAAPAGDGSADIYSVRVVVLLPMSVRQIELFARSSGVNDAVAFLAEIRRQNAWVFARRPLDLSELISTWTALGRLGTRVQQHEANIAAKLKDRADRPDNGVVSDAQAREGVERLALALALTRTRTLRSPEQKSDTERVDGVLDPSGILLNWTEAQRQALLRRALFDPATYGRVRFHHRSVQEYLAARRLMDLRSRGMSVKAVFRLLFAQPYGVEVVIPSMRGIAAWLSLWDDAVRQELMRREPETLLSLGDPETLTMAARSDLVCAFAAAYGEGGWRGLRIPIDEVRRLAHPDLAPTIRSLWENGPTNIEVRELLIQMVWQGPIEACLDLASIAAFNASGSEHERVAAVRALLVCGRHSMAREIADAIFANPASWPGNLVHSLAADLFPQIISVDELLTLIERTPEPTQSFGGFERALREITGEIDPRSGPATALRDKITDLVWRTRHAEQEFYRIRSRFTHLAPALATLCDRQLAAGSPIADGLLTRACVVASRFGNDESVVNDSVNKLRMQISNDLARRRDIFWAELAFMDELIPVKDSAQRLYHAAHHSLIDHLGEIDRPWLEAELSGGGPPDRRPVALQALLDLWRQRGRVEAELEVLRGIITSAPELEALLPVYSALQASPRLEKMERDERCRQSAAADHETKRLADWKTWRNSLLADPAAAFGDDKRLITLKNVYVWLQALATSRTRYNIWNHEAVIQAFGSDVALRVVRAFADFWRATPPVLWSARPPSERDNMPYSWAFGLCGISAEAATPGWAARLSPEEVRIATAYATIELNGFASFILDLANSYPTDVESVLGGELSAELKVAGDHDHLPILQDLTYAATAVKQLVRSRLLAALSQWPATAMIDAGRWGYHLDHVLTLLRETSGQPDRQMIAQECARRYRVDPSGPLALVWLRNLFRIDAERGAQELTEAFVVRDPVTRWRAIETFADLFGGHDAVVFEISDIAQRARTLGHLVRSAFSFVRSEDDQTHEGSYSPNTRDRAEIARGFLLSRLLDTPGAEARRVILELAAESDFARFPDRLRLLARQRAAADAEFEAFDAPAIAVLEHRYEAPPRDRDGLFSIMIDRLDDLAYDLAHHDFTDRRTLRTINDEIDMQRTLAWRISNSAKGMFIVTREEEVADLKRTDIRLAAVGGDQKAVIEVKLADSRWSLADLERALRDQIVGQYLRHGSCKAGCLLLTYNGQKKQWTHPKNKKRLTFRQVVLHLNDLARALEIESLHAIRLSVFGLELTDPILAPAHR